MIKLRVNKPIILKSHLKLSRVVDGDGVILNNLFDKSEIEKRFLGIDATEIKSCRKLYKNE